jgi:diguanylate cyclase (GGDEF)-like protein
MADRGRRGGPGAAGRDAVVARVRRRRGIARPVVARPRVVAVTTAVLFTVAGLLALTATLLSPGDFANLPAVRALAVTAVATGVVTACFRNRFPVRAAHGLVTAGTALITVAVHMTAHSPTSVALASLYVLIAVDSAFFFSWPAAVGHLTVATVSGGVVLWSDHDVGAGPSLVVAGTAVLVAGVVAWLVRAAGAAETDALTGLPNRRGLDRLLDDAITVAERSGAPLTLAVIDLDHFKAVNDSAGHQGGDLLLIRTAHAWAALLGPGQSLARLGGDEFVVLLPGTGLETALGVVQRLRGVVPDGRTCSVGVAERHPDDASSLLSSADAALYEAKRAGRDCVRHHGHTAAIRTEVRGALARGEIVVHYQRVVDLATGRTAGTEALVRWQHPERGLVPPGDFLPLLEGSTLLADVGRFVLTEACAQTAAWRRDGSEVTVAVNVAGEQLLDPGYAEQLAEILAATGLPAAALVLEVTESSLDADTALAQRTLEAVRALGVGIAVDDFGTGYSSLARLGRLPVDLLKIDRSFVVAVPEGATEAPMIQAITAMAAALGLEVVAEGVEDEGRARLLRRLGCGYAQGYLFGRAVPAAELDLLGVAAVGDHGVALRLPPQRRLAVGPDLRLPR